LVGDDPKHPWADVETSPERLGAGHGDAPAVPEEPRFVDRGELAVGGTSSIRHVFDTRIRRLAAMKVIDPMMASWPEAARLLVEEAQITGQLDHPNIVPVHDLGVSAEGLPMFVMKLIAGRTLTDLIREPVRDLPRMLKVLLKVCDAVAFAHSRGVVHRDLKPDNVMIGSHGQVYVMDWGCAQLMPGMRTEPRDDDDFDDKTRVFEPPVALESGGRRVIDGTGTVIGTGAYMAPEQAWGRTDEIDARTDVFALGGTLYQILTRRPPYQGRNHLESVQLAQQATLAAPQTLVSDAPSALCRIVMRAMATERRDRYPSVEAFAADVEQFLLGGHHFEERTYPAGAIVMKEGDDADAAYVVIDGTCEAYRMDGGEKQVLRRMGAGEVFGETALLAGGPRTATVAAVDDLHVQVVTRASLDEALRAGSWLATLVKVLAERFREADEKLRDAARSQPRQE
jgi:hypothetical protein